MPQLYLVRHAHAGKRSDWHRPDEQRPLSPKGQAQAEALATQLGDAGIDVLVTSPYVRCRQTLEPLAANLGLTVVDLDALTEGSAGPVALDALLELVAAGHTVAACSHGDVLPAAAQAAVRRGATITGMSALPKAARFEATVGDGQITKLVTIDPPSIAS